MAATRHRSLSTTAILALGALIASCSSTPETPASAPCADAEAHGAVDASSTFQALMAEDVPSADAGVAKDTVVVDAGSPAEDQPSVTADVPSVDVPIVDVPTVDVPTADVPSVDVPSVDAPAVDAGTADDAGAAVSIAGRSCRRALVCGGAGSTTSCCDSIAVPAGTLLMGRSLDGADAYNVPNPEELPEHPVALPGFYLDRFEVTVGRFREFVESWRGEPLPAGAGAHPNVPGSGWRAEWNSHLPRSSEALAGALHCDAGQESWRDFAGPDDTRPVGCLNWYEAFAFCVWDGGRLPTESEWEYAAGGEENRLYPWGSRQPDCSLVRPFDNCHDPEDILAPVGSVPAGRGPFGHQDFAGSAEEFVLDYFDDYRLDLPGVHARVSPPTPTYAGRVLRGLSFWGGGGDMRVADRGHALPDSRYARYGVRCARDVPVDPLRVR